MQAGINEVSAFSGLSTKELRRTYRHHPDIQGAVACAKMRKLSRS